ncbi:hypothetical protein WJX81_001534 [Elliptochloris bilobata]|uniref:SET domain-containing protein n=1 Tax=Elliptochloris bilobata TaxID=381761 RepID=A0AAW1R4A9_9CHLO
MKWYVANGGVGVGPSDSKLAIFEMYSGERGLLFAEILPDSVPSVYGAIWPEALEALEGAPPAIDVAGVRQFIAQQYADIADPKAALGGAGKADVAWALSVVLSRSFGSPSPGGGVGVWMLVPLLDLLNHAGIEDRVKAVVDRANVSWKLVRTHEAAAGQWEMVLSAKRATEEGEEARLSYVNHGSAAWLTICGGAGVAEGGEAATEQGGFYDSDLWYDASARLSLATAGAHGGASAVTGVDGDPPGVGRRTAGARVPRPNKRLAEFALEGDTPAAKHASADGALLEMAGRAAERSPPRDAGAEAAKTEEAVSIMLGMVQEAVKHVTEQADQAEAVAQQVVLFAMLEAQAAAHASAAAMRMGCGRRAAAAAAVRTPNQE